MRAPPRRPHEPARWRILTSRRVRRRPVPIVPLAMLLVPVMAGMTAGSGRVPDDPALVDGLQWNLERIGAPEAWSRSTGAGVTVAVIDSGADLAHVDLRRAIVGSADCIGAAGDPGRCRTGGPAGQDDSGHGTHVAGIVAATTGNGTGVAGVAPDARLLVVRSLTAGCDRCPATGAAADVAAGVRWAVANGADVINLSLGGGQLIGEPGCGYCDALDEAWASGVIPVLATGNDAGPSTAADRHAVIVAATDRDDRAASYSAGSAAALTRARWSLSAPGGESETDDADCATGGAPRGVLSTYWRAGSRDLYACLAGTSMAAPHVAGVLALLLAQGRRPVDAVERLLATATDLGRPGPDPVYGAGRVDAARAVGPRPAPSAPARTPGDATAATAAAPPSEAAGPAATTTTTVPPVMSDDLAGAPMPSHASRSGESDRPAWAVPLAAVALAAAWTGWIAARPRRSAPPAR